MKKRETAMLFISLFQYVFTEGKFNKYFTLQLLEEPEKKLSVINGIPVLEVGPDSTSPDDPNVIFMEDVEFNVLRLKVGDGYLCKHPNADNMSLTVCKSKDDPYTEWTTTRLDNFYLISTRTRGLCLGEISSTYFFKTTKKLSLGQCSTKRGFRWTFSPIESLNEKEEGPVETPGGDAQNRKNKFLQAGLGAASSIFKKFADEYYPYQNNAGVFSHSFAF